jgi:hypothetical protein
VAQDRPVARLFSAARQLAVRAPAARDALQGERGRAAPPLLSARAPAAREALQGERGGVTRPVSADPC